LTNYKKISKKSSHLAHFQRLYLGNFPDSERRDWELVLNLMQHERRFHVVTASENEEVMGFVSYWTFQQFCYIEHLAVDTPQRCRGVGSGLVCHVAAIGLPLLLEVEPPVDEATCRRIRFYEQLGLVLHDDIAYVQPPYAPGKPSVPMLLMTSRGMAGEGILEAIATLRSEVYHAQNDDQKTALF